MFTVDIMSRVPVYEQLVGQVERFILKGILKENDQIPSVRSLSTTLSVNPNTIQKAISELDRRGIVYSVPGRGCFVKPGAKESLMEKVRERLPELTALLKELVFAGVAREEILELVDRAFEKGGAK